MKKQPICISILIACISIISCKSNSSNEVELKFKLPKGSKYEYSASSGMSIKQEVNGHDMDINNETGFSYVFETKNDSANWKTIESTIRKISMDMQGGMVGKMHFDTDMELDSMPGPFAMMGKMFGALKGAKFSFAVNDKGDIGQITGIAELRQKMLAGIPYAAESMQSMKNGIEDETLKQNLQQAFAVYPGKPVKPGESWSKIVSQTMQGMTLKTEHTFTLQSVNGNDAEIKQVSKMVSDSSTSSSQRGVNVTGNANGTMQGHDG
jgi:uncharacterized protein DUF6263